MIPDDDDVDFRKFDRIFKRLAIYDYFRLEVITTRPSNTPELQDGG
jgi:hypothetical protein